MSTIALGNGNLPGPSNIIMELEVPLADADLVNHRTRIQRQILPGLYQAPESLERAITQMAAAVTMNTNDNRIAREEKAAKQNELKLPSDRFTVTLGILQGYLEINNEAHLPPIWHQWANCKKGRNSTSSLNFYKLILVDQTPSRLVHQL
jgi:hypothetical protein